MTAKKTSFIIPQKNVQNMDAWVANGSTDDTEKQKSVSKEHAVSSKVKRLTIDLDPRTHKDFKLKALSNDSNMVDLVRAWIFEFINKR